MFSLFPFKEYYNSKHIASAYNISGTVLSMSYLLNLHNNLVSLAHFHQSHTQIRKLKHLQVEGIC